MLDDAFPSADGARAAPGGLRLLRRSAGPVRAVQIYGQRCSGTNVLAKLIAANFGEATVTDRYGFKHWFVPDQILIPDDVLVLVVAREAFDWIRSLHRQPWHAHPDVRRLGFSEFVRTEWHSYWDDEAGVGPHHPMFNREMLHERDPATGRRFANPLRKRAAKLKAWSGLAERASNVGLLDQEMLTAAPQALLAAVGRALNRLPADDLAVLASYKGNGFNRFVPRRYEPLSAEDREFVRSQLDPDVEGRFGFRLESPVAAGTF